MTVVPPSLRAVGLLAALAGMKLLIPWIADFVSGYGIFRDEYYYLACGQRLDFGYVDHPPLIALVAALTHTVLGDSLFALHLLPTLAGAGMVVLTGLMAWELGGGRFAQALAGLIVVVAPIYWVVNGFLSTIPFDHFFFVLLAYLVIRLVKSDDPRWWPAIGLVIGLGLENKHNFLFLTAGVVAGILLTAQRRWLRNRWFWGGVAVAMLLALPHFLWQAQHGWPLLEFARNAGSKNVGVDVLGFVGQQVVVVHPLTLPIWGAGLVYYLRGAGSVYRILGLMYLIPALILLATGAARADYLTPTYPMLFAAGAVVTEQWLARRRSAWARPVLAGGLLLSGAALAPFFVAILPAVWLVSYQQALGISPPQQERGKTAEIPQYFADRLGWEGLVATIAEVYQSLPAADRAHTTILTVNYGEAAAINYYGARYGLPAAVSGHNNYYLWGPGPAWGSAVISLGIPTARLNGLFNEVRQAALITCDYCTSEENTLPVYVSRRPQLPIDQAWPLLKHYN